MRSCLPYPTLNSSGAASRAQRSAATSVRLATEAGNVSHQDWMIRGGQRGEQAIAEGGPLGLYLRGWSEADPAKIIDATADGYDFYDPLVGRFSRHTLAQYFALLRARFSVGRAVRWPELAFNLRGPMQNRSSEVSYQFWREAPMLGLTGASSIAMTPAGIVAETVTYDLNIACDWLRR